MKVQNMPKEEQPREKSIENGIKSLNNLELLAILIRCGTKEKSVFDLSLEVLNLFENMLDLEDMTIDELLKIKGIGVSKATIILAALEFSKRLIFKKTSKIKVPSPIFIHDLFKPIFLNLKQENLYAIYLDSKCQIIDKKLITIGNINSLILDDKMIFKWAYKLSASGIILVHNHPSGDPKPSMEDINSTSEFCKQAKLLNFIVLDHIIIGNGFYSFKMENKFWNNN